MTNLSKLFNITQSSRVIFIYPHPDDETFANAKLISLLVHNKINVRVVCLTKGEASTLRSGVGDKDLGTARETEFKKVMEHLNVLSYEILDLPDGHLELFPNLDNIVSKIIKEYSPTHIFTYEPYGIYGHPDHMELTKIITKLKDISNYQVIYSTVSPKYKSSKEALAMAKNPNEIKPIKPNVILQLSVFDYVRKLKALKLYKSQFTMKSNFFHKLKHLVDLKSEYYYKGKIDI